MKKIKNLLWLIFLEASPALAIPPPENPGGVPENLLGDPTAGTTGVITQISSALLMLIGVVAVLFLIIGGFQYITSAGNPDNIAKAKNTILYGVIGIVFVLLAYAIVQFVITNINK